MEDDSEEDHLAHLNRSLSILAPMFPRILPDVFREMLQTFQGESGLHIVAERLSKHQDQWVRGRWRKDAIQGQSHEDMGCVPRIAVEDEFRRASYKCAVRKVLCDEFRALSKSKVEAVLAEENFYYTRARPTLQKLASKSWRNTVNVFIARWCKNDTVSKDHYMSIWPKNQGEDTRTVPMLKQTGDAELDEELRQQVLQPLLETIGLEREAQDWDAAMRINETEAQQAAAMYECQCCYSESTWEQIATCTSGGHIICFNCIWRAVSEALFGQGWGRNIDHRHGQIKCLASVLGDNCDGWLPQHLTHRAVSQAKGGKEVLARLETRLAEAAVSKSGLPLVRCPICNYAEVDDLYLPPSIVRYRLDTSHLKSMFLLLLIMFNFLPMILGYIILTHVQPCQAFPRFTNMFSRSLGLLIRKHHLPRRFKCRSPSCGLPSCLNCLKTWHDPHTCHESASLSLRTTVEAARTAALKRTCPRCGLGFIKDSGCNKLTCVCGYTMCYICRQGLQGGPGVEGYRHFCQHFRAAGGICKECDKCDLYKNEDDEALVKRAGAFAEKEWREKEGMIGVEGLDGGQAEGEKTNYWRCEWNVQELLDWWVGQVLTC